MIVYKYYPFSKKVPIRGNRGHDHNVDGFTTTYAICAYQHYICEFEPCSWRGVLDTTLCDKVCQRLVTGRWFSPGTPVSFTNKTDHHYITEILLKLALNTINPPKKPDYLIFISLKPWVKKQGSINCYYMGASWSGAHGSSSYTIGAYHHKRLIPV